MTQSIHQYLLNKQKREQHSFIVNNEGQFYRCKGLLIPAHEFEYSLFPLADKIRVDKGKGDNIGSANI